jgi:3-dehydroquinate synthetase/shikimate kinase
METVLVGAPGCGARTIGRSLAERHGARFVDLTGEPGRRADALAGLRLTQTPDAGGSLRTVIAADRIVADPSVRARLYRGRHVIWLDVPADHLVERLRAARRQDIEIEGDIRAFIADHLTTYRPYYLAGTRVDASGSTVSTIAEIQPILAQPIDAGTLILRAEVHGGLIELGDGILSRSLGHVLQRSAVRRCAVITTARSRDRADVAIEVVRTLARVPVEVEELPDGEPSKLLEHQEHLFRRLADRHLERGDPLIALGDDVLLEAATFAAAVWLRGVPLVAIPVTTLGLIDTSIGGKGGIDLPGVGRNLLGAIYQPTATILDIGLVDDESVPDRRAALAEAVKYGLIGDDGLLSLLESGGRGGSDQLWPRGSELLELVERCALAKRDLVLRDERDTRGVRMALNLGHTLSHALETATGYRLRHGTAVAYGLRAALHIGTSTGVTPPAIAARATRLLDRLGLATERLDIQVSDVLDYIEADKKRRDGKLRWVLVGVDGITIRDDVPTPVVQAAVIAALSGSSRRQPPSS